MAGGVVMEPTTGAMVEAAQDAYDVAAADAAVALAKWRIASAAEQYAKAVLVSTRADLRVSA